MIEASSKTELMQDTRCTLPSPRPLFRAPRLSTNADLQSSKQARISAWRKAAPSRSSDAAPTCCLTLQYGFPRPCKISGRQLGYYKLHTRKVCIPGHPCGHPLHYNSLRIHPVPHQHRFTAPHHPGRTRQRRPSHRLRFLPHKRRTVLHGPGRHSESIDTTVARLATRQTHKLPKTLSPPVLGSTQLLTPSTNVRAVKRKRVVLLHATPQNAPPLTMAGKEHPGCAKQT